MGYELRNVTVTVENRSILKNITCTIEDGKWIAAVGQTGAGKSTFVQLLKGLISFEGDYFVHHKPVEKDSKGTIRALAEVGIVFQYPEHQLFETTIYKELAFGLKMLGYTTKEIDDAIHSILPKLGLTKEMLELPPFQLSGGQKRRVVIASILLMKPKLLIVDEPTAGLDPVSHLDMLQLFKSWQHETEGTILFVSHKIEDVAEYADEVLVFHQGELRAHLETACLFLDNPQLLEQAGLVLPEAVQALQLVEQKIGKKIKVASCKEQDILEALRPYLCGVSE